MRTGIGLRQPHYQAVLKERPALGFVEVHSENFFGDGGAALAVLHEAREHYAVSLHGVGLALGSAAGLDRWHLGRLARLAERIEPVRVSDHASFARAPLRPGGPVGHANELLPIAWTQASLDLMVAQVSQVQDRLRRALLVENISAYLQWPDADYTEPAFFNALAQRSGCGLLLDVNNLVVNALNGARNGAAADPVRAACEWIDALHPGVVGEIHLAGHRDLGDIVIDDHGSRVAEPVWRVYRHAIARLGPQPTLIEWDTELPALDVLLGEAAQAERVMEAA